MDRSVAAPGRDAKAAREWDGRCVQCLAGTALRQGLGCAAQEQLAALAPLIRRFAPPRSAPTPCPARRALRRARAERPSVGWGKRVTGGVNLGGGRNLTKTNNSHRQELNSSKTEWK